MKTEFSQFCLDYAHVLKPLRGILQESVESLRDKPGAGALKATLSGLTDLHHRLKTLLDKVEDQQAYLIIFGPLKSGKSTLMNAISSAYVSEVSSLPAYPCLVYVRHGDEPQITVTRYNGKTDEFADSNRMQEAITRSHGELADRIRQAEEQGEIFDPGNHFTDAIRRIDIDLQADALKQSSTVLVDTPGLYSRMRFGYDLMTREFRDSAACAVFVVKTDNLFLEQVFAEFNDLLDLFSRIFLVVNIDTGKRDLGPDGQLHPSVESAEPAKIVEAFRSLSMGAPLRRAFDEGRLKIYPIDVLTAACSNLQADSTDSGDETTVTTGEESESLRGPGSIWTGFKPPVLESIAAVKLPRTAGHGSDVRSGDTFEQFLDDLTDYLNSSDYLVNFMGDSLRQGRTLLVELEAHVSAHCLHEFRQKLQELKEELGLQQKRRQAVGELDGENWEAAFAATREICAKDGEQFAASQSQRLRSDLSAAVDDWFKSDQSLEQLLRDHLRPGITDCLGQVRDDIQQRMRRATSGPRCGAEFDGSQMSSLATAGIQLPELQQKNSLVPTLADQELIEFDGNLSVDAVPVKKTFLDWMLFRTAAKVRRKIFGSGPNYDQKIPAKVKAARFGDVGRLALGKQLGAKLDAVVPGVATRLAENCFKDYGKGFAKAIEERVGEIRMDLDESIPALSGRIEDAEEILSVLDQLGNDARAVGAGVAQLEREFFDSHPAVDGSIGSDEDNADDESDFVLADQPLEDDVVGDSEEQVSQPAAETDEPESNAADADPGRSAGAGARMFQAAVDSRPDTVRVPRPALLRPMKMTSDSGDESTSEPS